MDRKNIESNSKSEKNTSKTNDMPMELHSHASSKETEEQNPSRSREERKEEIASLCRHMTAVQAMFTEGGPGFPTIKEYMKAARVKSRVGAATRVKSRVGAGNMLLNLKETAGLENIKKGYGQHPEVVRLIEKIRSNRVYKVGFGNSKHTKEAVSDLDKLAILLAGIEQKKGTFNTIDDVKRILEMGTEGDETEKDENKKGGRGQESGSLKIKNQKYGQQLGGQKGKDQEVENKKDENRYDNGKPRLSPFIKEFLLPLANFQKEK